MLLSLVALALLASAQGRVVNISNTWVLPEEGFPVFYRYFRDRISWYEADAVCQFHHANLVTVDTTAQYDAVRAYLKELDIASAVWVGLIRSNPDGDFTWTDYRGLSGDGYWSSAPDTRSAPLCAAADPAADYRWEARACGGPMVASFICELPVPQWASGLEGCMVRELPALTILYLPESAAVQLTADCGLAGVKRVQCTGNVKREDLLRDLSCIQEAEEPNVTSEIATETITTEISIEQDTSQDVSGDESITTEKDEVAFEQSLIRVTPIPYQLRPIIKEDKFNNAPLNLDKNINIIHDQNLESNDIPKYMDENNFLSEEESNKLEDEKHMAHKQLHNDLARLGNIGNFESIFNQPSDHFIPPLVMAKAKISDDMTVLSLEEKHAQQLAEQQKHKGYGELDNRPVVYLKPESITSTEVLTTENPLMISITPIKNKHVLTKETKTSKYGPSKKYEKHTEMKSKNVKAIDKSFKYAEKAIPLSPIESTTKRTEETIAKVSNDNNKNTTAEDHSVDLEIILKESFLDHINITNSTSVYKLNTSSSTNKDYRDNKTIKDYIENILSDTSTHSQNETAQGMTQEIIKLTNPNENHQSTRSNIFKVTTVIPLTDRNKHIEDKNLEITTQLNGINKDDITSETVTTGIVTPKSVQQSAQTKQIETTLITLNNAPTMNIALVAADNKTKTIEEFSATSSTHSTKTEKISTPSSTIDLTESSNESNITSPVVYDTTPKVLINATKIANNTETHEVEHEDLGLMDEIPEHGIVESTETEENFQSPLLSAANEPLHRPIRSRRPSQTQIRIKKFNPFRILG